MWSAADVAHATSSQEALFETKASGVGGPTPHSLQGDDMMRSNRLFDQQGELLYSGLGTISRETLNAAVDGRVFIETDEGLQRLSRAEGDTEDEIRRLLATAERLGGQIPEVTINVDTFEGENVSATIQFPPQVIETPKVNMDSVVEILQSIHTNALRENATVGGFERNIREGISLTEGLHGGRLPVNVIPSSVKGACEETVLIFAGCIPQGSIHRPSVAVISERHPMEVEDESYRHEHTIWREPLNQFSNEFVAENLDVASHSGCLQGTWKDIHIFMPESEPIIGAIEALDNFIEAVDEVHARTGRDIRVTIHWQDGVEEVEI